MSVSLFSRFSKHFRLTNQRFQILIHSVRKIEYLAICPVFLQIGYPFFKCPNSPFWSILFQSPFPEQFYYFGVWYSFSPVGFRQTF